MSLMSVFTKLLDIFCVNYVLSFFSKFLLRYFSQIKYMPIL